MISGHIAAPLADEEFERGSTEQLVFASSRCPLARSTRPCQR
jgi:hypothetical protein